MKGPKVQGVNSLLVKDIGSAIRSLVGMRARTFHDLEQSEQWKVWNALSPWYMWDNNDIVTVRWIMDTAQARYKEWKWQCHNVYQERGPEGMPTEFYGREDEWAFLCTHFESDAFKKLSNANKKNRGKKTMHHHSGSSPIVYIMEDLRNKGEPLPIIKGFEQSYVRPGDEVATKKYEEMLALVKSRKTDLKKINPEATEEEMMEIIQTQQIDVLDAVLDKRKGKEIRGMGRAGERDLSQSSSGSTLRSRAPPNQDRERIERLEREVREYKERTELAEVESAWYRNQYTTVNSRMDQIFSRLGLEPEGPAPPHSSPGPPPPQSSLIPPPTQSSPPPLPTQSSPAFVDKDQFLNLY